MKKKIAVWLLCLTVICSMFSMPALAAETAVLPSATEQIAKDAAEDNLQESFEKGSLSETLETDSKDSEPMDAEVNADPASEEESEYADRESAAGDDLDDVSSSEGTDGSEEEGASADVFLFDSEEVALQADEASVKEQKTVAQKVTQLKVTVKKYGRNSKRLMVEWNNCPEADGYYVYRSIKKKSGFKLVNITETACRFLDSGLSAKTTYYYKVRAYKGHPLKKPYTKKFLNTSNVASCKTPSANVGSYYTKTNVSRTAANTVTVKSADKSYAQKVFNKLEKGKNFYLYVKSKDPAGVLKKLKSKVRKISEWSVGFTTLGSYGGNGGRYYLVDAMTYKLVRNYVRQAYNERMAEYKIYLECGKKKAYFTTYKGIHKKTRKFVAKYKTNMFECEYGTPFKDLSSESKFLFITPGTEMTVRTDYMIFRFNYNVQENAYDILMKMYHKNAEGVCRHYALALQTICDHLGIPCWQPVDWGYNHQWGFVKVKTEKGKTVYYTMDNEMVHQTRNEKDLLHERLGEYRSAVKAVMGSQYPW